MRLVWGNVDPYFPIDLGHRLATAFHDATLTEVDGARTFVPLGAPDRVAAEILDLSVGTASQRTVVQDKAG